MRSNRKQKFGHRAGWQENKTVKQTVLASFECVVCLAATDVHFFDAITGGAVFVTPLATLPRPFARCA